MPEPKKANVNKKKTLYIRSITAIPEAATGLNGDARYKLSAIKKWLADTSPTEVSDAGAAYGHASNAIKNVCDAVERSGVELGKKWEGFGSSEVQEALRRLHATGHELAGKMEMMSTTLKLYGETYLPRAREQVAWLNPISEAISPNNLITPETPMESLGRKAMQELNEKIVELYDMYIPQYVSYDLDIPSPPEGVAAGGNASSSAKSSLYAGSMPFSSDPSSFRGDSSASDLGGSNGSANYPGAGTGELGTDGTGGGSDVEGSDPNGSDPGGAGSGGPGSDGPGSDGSGADGSGTDGSGADGSGSDGTTEDEVGAGDESGQGPEFPPADDANGTGAGQDTAYDETVDSVIGGNNDAFANDPRSTEVENFTPPPSTTITPPHSPSMILGPTAGPPGMVTGPPGVPSVLGGPGFGAGTMGMGEATSVMARGATSGMPMMPMMPMGGGGMGGEGGQEFDSPYELSEDHDVWKCDDDVTSPTITQSV